MAGQHAALNVAVVPSPARTPLPPRPPVEARTALQQTAKPRSKTATRMLAYRHRLRPTALVSGATGQHAVRRVVAGRRSARTALPQLPWQPANNAQRRMVRGRSKTATKLLVPTVPVSGATGDYVARCVVAGRRFAPTLLPPRPLEVVARALRHMANRNSRRATRLIAVRPLHVLVSGATGESAVYLVG